MMYHVLLECDKGVKVNCETVNYANKKRPQQKSSTIPLQQLYRAATSPNNTRWLVG